MIFVRAVLFTLLLPSLCGAKAMTEADVVDVVNSIRGKGCAKRAVAAPALRRVAELDAAAKHLRAGRSLEDAIADAGYRARAASSIQIRGDDSGAAVTAMLERRFCRALMDEDVDEIGVARQAEQTWIVLAAAFVPPTPAEMRDVQQRVLDLVNSARAQKRRCGRKRFDAAAALTPSAPLARAALDHARDLAAFGRLSHKGSDGAGPADRVSRAGYQWAIVAENVASGAETADEVVTGWLESPSHCSNLMNPLFTEMGVAYAASPDANGIYWAQVFGASRLRGNP